MPVAKRPVHAWMIRLHQCRLANLMFILPAFLPCDAAFAGPPRYTVVDTGPEHGDAINDRDQVAGHYFHDSLLSSFLWERGNVIAIPDQQCTDFQLIGGPTSISESARVAGYQGQDLSGDGTSRAWLWVLGDSEVTCIPQGGGGVFTGAVNDRGVLVYSRIVDPVSNAWTWFNGVSTPLPGYTQDGSAEALDINNFGHAVGWADSRQVNSPGYPTIWIDGEPQMLDMSMMHAGFATSINDREEVIGSDTHGVVPFLWKNGVFSELPEGGRNGYFLSLQISDAGDIAATWVNLGGGGYVPYVYENGAWVDLNTLIDPNSGWSLYAANGVNAAGRIVGSGSHNGSLRAFMLIPTDQLRNTGPIPGLAGRVNEIDVHGAATPGDRVYLAYSMLEGSTAVPHCPGVTLDLDHAKLVVPYPVRADANGDARFRVFVPAFAAGKTFIFQAVDIDDCTPSAKPVWHHFPAN